MLDAFVIFTRGGCVLFSEQLVALRGEPVEALVRDCLLTERAGGATFSYAADGAAYALKWAFHNEKGLVFVAVHQRVLALTYVEDLLARARQQFVEGHYSPERREYPEFAPEFRALLAAAEARAAAAKVQRTAPTFEQARRAQAAGDKAVAGTPSPAPAATPRPPLAPSPASGTAAADTGAVDGVAFDVSKLALRKKGASPAAPSPAAVKGKTPEEKKSGKKARVWGAGGGDSPAQLDFSSPPPGGAAADAGVDGLLSPQPLAASAMDAEDDSSSDEDDDEADSGAADACGTAPGAAKKARGWFSAVLASPAVTSVVGKASLERADVAPLLDAMKTNLLRKNVASEIADALCDSVAASLEGRRQAALTSLAGTVRSAVEAALTRILTPPRGVDILADVAAARARAPPRPYVIVFVGVNGVGKSTNLAKVAHWLGANGSKVLVAACDTFRAGAVEQLRTHCTRLNVPLFERGYEKDPAAVAAEAVRTAARTGRDVVLVDTAGRMQDNEPLMRALSKLINDNRPDLVLFVGEALVGNDAVDQLAKFNSRLADLSADAGTTRVIDGILLTKFDTIDDKVGAALSMVYTSGAPVMFVGTGQTYADLRRFSPKTVVKSLLR